MNNICYVANPQAWESPKGVMMRTAHHNGYRTVASMCGTLNVPCSGDGLELLIEQSPLIRKLSTEAPQISLPLSNNAYTMNSPDIAHWSIDEVTFYRSQFSEHFKYCPTCLSNELVTIFSDLSDLPACPLHQTQLITNCPNCHQHERWTQANLLFCSCGFDRRETQYQPDSVLDVDHLETFGPDSYIRILSHKLTAALACDEIWQSRKPNSVQTGGSFADTIYKHAASMLSYQMTRYPGFTRAMHLAPWIASHPLLVSLAEEMVHEKSTINAKCVSGLCCTDVSLTMSELVYSVGGVKEWPKDKNFITRNFNLSHRQFGDYFYHCHTPICRMINALKDKALMLKSKKEVIASDYFSTPEAAKRLQCSSGEVIQLAELGFLKRFRPDGKIGSGHPVLIHKQSVSNFNNFYILVGHIASKLKTSPINAVRLLNQQGIESAHNKLGPHVYEAHKIHSAWEKLTTALANPVLLQPIVLPPTKSIQNTMRITDSDRIARERTAQPQKNSENNICEIVEHYPYTTRQAASYLNISGRLLRTRFVLTGLITPEIKDGKPYYSLPQIEAMEYHIHQHMSLEQVTKFLKCGYFKAAYLINLFNIQPSCVLAYSNGNRQFLYNKQEIFNLKDIAKKRAKRGSETYKRAARKNASR
ncbi:hypothetical protein [Pseudomonas sp. NPDC087336]|uniref:hypothetical protein n=1 Tax=Pseudomonas sp. NPDC087336 TaxID=3364436 RepID=UPI0038219569